jgi:DNA-binding HxlR family transcriptional regulator
MRSYGQYCALAKALDVIGDRWTLLIVRELLLRDVCRYTDLRNGLPGIATNLLVERLKELEKAGILSREQAPPPIATAVFRLTDRGRQLEPVIYDLGAWGAPLLADAPKTDHFQTYWLGLCARNCLRDREPGRPPVTIEIRTGADEPLTIEAAGGSIRTRPGVTNQPDVVMTGPHPVITAVLTGNMALSEARRAGLTYKGDPAILRRVQPQSRMRPRGDGRGAAR